MQRRDENTYFIDPSSEAELVRLIQMDRLLNKHTDILPQEFVPWTHATILDLACGPGGWALEVADRFELTQVIGIDIDPYMVKYARAQAQARDQDRVSFIEGNILNPLDFPAESFDFINARFLSGFMHASFWIPLLKECFRLLRPNGILRLTETATRSMPGSPTAEKYTELVMRAFWATGMTFSERELGIVPMLGVFLEQEGYTLLKEVPYLLNLSFGTDFYPVWQKGASTTRELIKPFLVRHVDISETELNALHRRIEQEMGVETYREHWLVTSVIAQK